MQDGAKNVRIRGTLRPTNHQSDGRIRALFSPESTRARRPSGARPNKFKPTESLLREVNPARRCLEKAV